MSPQRYLADSAAAAAAVGDFTAVLDELAPTARKARLMATAPRLDAAATRASAIIGRIDAQRLEDRRLEDQRARAAAALDDVEVAMRVVTDAARAGAPARMERASAQYADAVAALRGIATGS